MPIDKTNEIRILYARLKRIKIGQFLMSNEFDCILIEYNFHQIWKNCITSIRNQSTIAMCVPGYSGYAEKALESFLYWIFNQEEEQIHPFIIEILKSFNKWNLFPLDLSQIKISLSNLGFTEVEVSQLENERIQAQIPTENRSRGYNDGVDDLLDKKRKVFIVHAHGSEIRNDVARYLTEIGLDPVILDEQPSGGRSIMEKIENQSDVSFAIVILTPDDHGRAEGEEITKTRARQNVILELGYFMGRLGRENVCALHAGVEELPSDFSGVVYVPYDKTGGWKLNISKELRNAKIEIDMNKLIN